VNPASSLDEMAKLIDWTEVARDLGDIYSAVKDEPGWPPLALFKALLLATWYPFGCEAGGGCGGPSQLPSIGGFGTSEPHPIGQAAFATR
jgi:transposase, IS5 family